MRSLDTGLRWGLGVLVAVGLLGMAEEARAQDLSPGSVAEPIEPRTFGTSATVSHTLQAFAFSFVQATPPPFFP
jgi:hypothetical protein